MDKVLEKLGIYDLLAVLLTGICIVALSDLIANAFFQYDLSNLLKLDNATYFLTISYFVGVVFQEFGSVIQRRIFQKNELLESVFEGADKYDALTNEEIEGITQSVKKEMGMDKRPSKEVIYNYCKQYLNSKEQKGKADKDQALLAMSRSLSLYFALSCIILILSFLGGYKRVEIVLTVLGMVALSLLMYGRYIRFVKIRYVYILRSFYYDYIQRDLKDSEKEE